MPERLVLHKQARFTAFAAPSPQPLCRIYRTKVKILGQMAKRTTKRQSTLPEGAPKHVSTLETPAARASLFTVYIIISMVIAFSTALWYKNYSHPEVQNQSLAETQLWKVVDLPGKGKGVVALRNISVFKYSV
jgi:hypothetical protein